MYKPSTNLQLAVIFAILWFMNVSVRQYHTLELFIYNYPSLYVHDLSYQKFTVRYLNDNLCGQLIFNWTYLLETHIKFTYFPFELKWWYYDWYIIEHIFEYVHYQTYVALQVITDYTSKQYPTILLIIIYLPIN